MSIIIEDSTLREGEQSPGVVFSIEEKVLIAQKLQDAGVHAIEVGTPAMGGAEKEAIMKMVKAGLKTRLIGWNRGRRSDLDESFSCGLDSVHIGLPASDYHIEKKFGKSREWVSNTMQELVSYAKSQGAWVSVSAEDVGRANLKFLVEYASAAREAGADRIRLSDTIGVLDPFRVYKIVKAVVNEAKIPVQVHMHNDFGMSTANTLAGVKAGAQYVHVTVNGLGERAGIAPLDEVVMGLHYLMGVDVGIRTESLRGLCEYVAKASNRPIPPNKPIVGSSIFEHESGIHVDGILKMPDSFEPFPPEVIGAKRVIVIGKHTGSAAVQYVLGTQGIQTDRDQLDPVIQEIRSESTKLKRALRVDEVVSIYKMCNEE